MSLQGQCSIPAPLIPVESGIHLSYCTLILYWHHHLEQSSSVSPTILLLWWHNLVLGMCVMWFYVLTCLMDYLIFCVPYVTPWTQRNNIKYSIGNSNEPIDLMYDLYLWQQYTYLWLICLLPVRQYWGHIVYKIIVTRASRQKLDCALTGNACTSLCVMIPKVNINSTFRPIFYLQIYIKTWLLLPSQH